MCLQGRVSRRLHGLVTGVGWANAGGLGRGADDELAVGFQRIPNRRALPHYFEVISNPIAFSTIRVSTVRRSSKHNNYIHKASPLTFLFLA